MSGVTDETRATRAAGYTAQGKPSAVPVDPVAVERKQRIIAAASVPFATPEWVLEQIAAGGGGGGMTAYAEGSPAIGTYVSEPVGMEFLQVQVTDAVISVNTPYNDGTYDYQTGYTSIGLIPGYRIALLGLVVQLAITGKDISDASHTIDGLQFSIGTQIGAQDIVPMQEHVKIGPRFGETHYILASVMGPRDVGGSPISPLDETAVILNLQGIAGDTSLNSIVATGTVTMYFQRIAAL